MSINSGEITLQLSHPLTEEQWDIITDVDLEHTNSVWFHTKHGKDVEFVKVVRCKDCKWGKETCGNIECFADSNAPKYHGYKWFCPNGEKR